MIALEREGPVFLLRLRGGENRIDPDRLSELSRALDAVEASEGPAALVTTGEGRFYSNGLDVAALGRLPPERVRGFMTALHGLFARLLRFPLITVAAVNGHAFAAGAMLALAHDFRVMRADRGFLCLPEIDMKTGRPLTPGMVALLAARVEARALHEVVVSGRRYGALQAKALGLVHEALPEPELLPRAVALAAGQADRHRSTLAALKAGLFRAELGVLERRGDPFGGDT